jgi:hypothetical protein
MVMGTLARIKGFCPSRTLNEAFIAYSLSPPPPPPLLPFCFQKRGKKNPQLPKKPQETETTPSHKQTNKKESFSPLLSSQRQKTTKEYLNSNPTTKAAEKKPLQQPKSPQQFHYTQKSQRKTKTPAPPHQEKQGGDVSQEETINKTHTHTHEKAQH